MRYELARALSPLLPPLGAHRIRELLYPRSRAYRDNRPFLVHAVTGSPFCGSTRDLHEYEFSVHGYFDWRNVALARAACSQGDTIVEVGAKTIAFLDIVGANGTVHAIEPDPTLVARMKRNLGWATVGALRVHPCA